MKPLSPSDNWSSLIKNMKTEMAKEEVQCQRALRGKFDGTYMLRVAPGVKPQNFVFLLFIKLEKQKDPKAAVIDNSYGLGFSWRITKHGSLDDDLFIFSLFTDHSASKIFELRRKKWNFLRVEVNTKENYFSIQANDSGVLKEEITGDVRYSAKTELTLGGNKAGGFFIGEICYFGVWEI